MKEICLKLWNVCVWRKRGGGGGRKTVKLFFTKYLYYYFLLQIKCVSPPMFSEADVLVRNNCCCMYSWYSKQKSVCGCVCVHARQQLDVISAKSSHKNHINISIKMLWWLCVFWNINQRNRRISSDTWQSCGDGGDEVIDILMAATSVLYSTVGWT